VKYTFYEVYSENDTVQNTSEISSHGLYEAERQQASQESREKERMHLSFLAS